MSKGSKIALTGNTVFYRVKVAKLNSNALRKWDVQGHVQLYRERRFCYSSQGVFRQTLDNLMDSRFPPD